jgi:hypothetical protein
MKSSLPSGRRGCFLAAGCALLLLHEPVLLPRAGAQWQVLLPPGFFPAPQNLPDPIPLRRVLIPQERVATELKRAGSGVLVKLSRRDFEAQVQRAAQAAERSNHPPRLVEARYHARLLDEGALAGTGQWKILSPSAEPGLLSLATFNLALTHMQLDGSAAILGELDNRQLALLVDRQGEHQALLEWTARGEPGPNGLRFRLDIPASSLASVEVELPEDRVIELTSENCLLSSAASANKGRRLWRIDCPGSSQVDFLVQRVIRAAQALPLLLARLRARQNITLDQIEADFDFNVEVVHGSLRELSFECDPELRPLSVSVRNIECESWEWQPGAAPGKHGRLQLRLPAPVPAGALAVRLHFLAPTVDRGPWRCPGVRLSGAGLLGETLQWVIAPEIALDDWQPGDFELVRLEEPAGGGQVLTLTTTGRQKAGTAAAKAEGAGDQAKGVVPRRPRACLRIQTSQSRVRELLWWQIERHSQTLTAVLAYEGVRGSLVRMPIRLPADWKLEHVETTPAAALRQWVVVPVDKDWNRLVIEPVHALEPNQSLNVSLTLHRVTFNAPSESTQDKEALSVLPFPQVRPEQTQMLETSLGVMIDPSHGARIELQSATLESDRDGKAASPPPPAGQTRAPWGDRKPERLFRSREQPIRGEIALRSKRSGPRAQCTEQIVWHPDHVSVQARLLLQPEGGRPDAVDLYVSTPLPITWSWKSLSSNNEIRHVQRLQAVEVLSQFLPLGSTTAFECLGLLHLPPPRGTWWRLLLARPLDNQLLIEASGRLEAPETVQAISRSLAPLASEDPIASLGLYAAVRSTEKKDLRGMCEVPVFSLAGAGRTDGEIRMQPALPGRLKIQTGGLQEAGLMTLPSSGESWRVYRYHETPFSLLLDSREGGGQPAPAPRSERAELEVAVPPTGPLLHYYRFEVRNWTLRRLPVVLPSGSQLQTVRVDGRWLLDPPRGRAAAEGLIFDLPVPADEAPHSFELTYSLDLPAWRFWMQVEAPAPVLPIRSLTFQRRWRLPPGMAPLDEASYSRPPDTTTDPDTVWEPNAGVARSDQIIIVRRDRIWGLAWSLTGLLLLLAWQTRDSVRLLRYLFLVLWLAAGFFALLWLPATFHELVWLPLLPGLVLTGCWYLVAAWRSSRPLIPRPVGMAALVLIASLGVPIDMPGAGLGPETILLLPSSTDANQIVLVRQQLIEQLDDITRRGSVQQLGVVLLSARYHGQAMGERGDFDAEFQAYCFQEEPSKLFLPLSGIHIRHANVDGAVTGALPEVTDEPEKGYVLPIKGRGMHIIRLRFSVPLAVTGEPEVHFTIPKLAQSHLTWNVDHPVQYLFAVSARGAQSLHKEASRVRLDVDLGRLSVCQIRWRQAGKQPAAVKMDVRELYFCELRPGASRLLGVLQYQLSQGSSESLLIDLPPHLEVRHVEVDAGVSVNLPPRLRDWSVSEHAGRRKLELRFQMPITDGVQVYLDLVPLEPAQAIVTLPLPAPEGAAAARDSLLAYRVNGVRADLVDFVGVSAVEPEVFTTEWQTAATEDPGMPERAFSFRRTAGRAPALRLGLREAHEPPQCSQSLTWRIAAGAVDLQARARLVAAESQLALLEWQVPKALQVTDVSGPQVRSWCCSGQRLQVWLRQSAREATLDITGSLPRKSPGVAGAFHMPALAPARTQPPRSSVRVVAPEGFLVRPTRLNNLSPASGEHSAGNERTFVSQEFNYHGDFQLEPVAGKVAMALPKVDAADSRPGPSPSPSAVKTGKVPAIWFEEHQLLPARTRSYVHRAIYWVAAESTTEFGVDLPPGTELQSVTLDGQEEIAAQADSTRIQMLVVAGQKLRIICLTWTYPEGDETLAHPNLAVPLLRNVRQPTGPALVRIWHLQAPAGYRAVALQNLQEITAAEAEQVRTKALQRSGLPSPGKEKDALAPMAATFWQQTNLSALPQVQLLFIGQDQEQRALAGTALLLVLVLIACLLPLFPRLVHGIQAFWPEQLVLLGCVGWLWLNGNVILGIVALLGLAARCGYLAAWLVARQRRPAVAGGPAGSGAPSR